MLYETYKQTTLSQSDIRSDEHYRHKNRDRYQTLGKIKAFYTQKFCEINGSIIRIFIK